MTNLAHTITLNPHSADNKFFNILWNGDIRLIPLPESYLRNVTLGFYVASIVAKKCLKRHKKCIYIVAYVYFFRLGV